MPFFDAKQIMKALLRSSPVTSDLCHVLVSIHLSNLFNSLVLRPPTPLTETITFLKGLQNINLE